MYWKAWKHVCKVLRKCMLTGFWFIDLIKLIRPGPNYSLATLIPKPNTNPRSTLQFQIIVPPCLLIFWFFVGALPLLSYLDHLRWLIFQILFCFCFTGISEIVKTDCSICETVNSLIQTILISFNPVCKLSHFSWKERH